MTPLRVDIIRRPVRIQKDGRLKLLQPLHKAWGLEDPCLTGLCRKLVAAGIPDCPAYTWDDSATGYGMRIKSVHRYARLTIREETGDGTPRHVPFVPYAGPRSAQDGLRDAAE
jgi:hypothetical protein